MEFVELDMGGEMLQAIAWQRLVWKDFRLAWDPEKYNNVSSIHFSPDNIWTPIIKLYNSLGDYNNEASYITDAIVSSDGTVEMTQPRFYTSTCKTNGYLFPFDSQICPFVFGPWFYSPSELKMKIGKYNKTDREFFRDTGGWKQKAFWGNNTTWEAFENLTTAEFKVELDRQYIPYCLNILLPTMLISILSLLIFLLPVDSGEKVDFGMTIFLTLCVNALVLQDAVPATSSTTALLTKFNSVVTGMVALSLVIAIISTRLLRVNIRVPPLPIYLRIFLYYFGFFFCIRFRNWRLSVQESPDEIELSSHIRRKSSAPVYEQAESKMLNEIRVNVKRLAQNLIRSEAEDVNYNEWMKLAKLIDTIFALIFVIMVLFSLYTYFMGVYNKHLMIDDIH